jgi:PiT family inorganic phosphate transporter
MALLTVLGASLLSHRVLATVGEGLVDHATVGLPAAAAMVGSAFVLTTLFNALRLPTSTIQILVFCIVGVALAEGYPIRWSLIGRLALLWALAPVAALVLGVVFVRVLDRLQAGDGGGAGVMASALVAMGGCASLAMGANDVSNATAVFLATHLAGPLAAGVIGGLGLAAGVLTWGRPLLERVAFDVVRMDLRMATAAQFVQAVLVLTAVAFGYFTSMNQALIGAMMGAGLARGQHAVRWPVVRGILLGWLIGPAAGLALGAAAGVVARAFH